MVIAAHPDDETLGFGGVLARYASEGVETFVVTATRGQAGRYFGHRQGTPEHPGPEKLALLREQELRTATKALGVHEVFILDYLDQQLDQAPVDEIVSTLAGLIRRVRPQVVLTFPHDGAYGHPDHIAISQFAGAAIVAAAHPHSTGPAGPVPGAPHAVSKMYHVAWNQATWTAYQAALRKLISTVDGVERQANPWPDWALTTVVDTRAWWETIWGAVSRHESQVGNYAALKDLAPEQHQSLWGSQSFYRVFSLVNAGRQVETDLFEGLRA